MKDYAKRFYKSQQWKRTRAAYMNRVGGLCEECLAHGIYTPAEIVHHKVHLTPENIDDPSVALAWSNLRAVCRECHAKEHEVRQDHGGRYVVHADGTVEIIAKPAPLG